MIGGMGKSGMFKNDRAMADMMKNPQKMMQTLGQKDPKAMKQMQQMMGGGMPGGMDMGAMMQQMSSMMEGNPGMMDQMMNMMGGGAGMPPMGGGAPKMKFKRAR